MADFNARIGSSKGYGNVMCKHGVGKRNENEDLVRTNNIYKNLDTTFYGYYQMVYIRPKTK